MNRLMTIDDDIKTSEMFAHYWLAMATTNACQKLIVSHGTRGDEFTPVEKVEYAMETAKRHIHQMVKLMDKKKELLYEKETSFPNKT